MNNLEIRPATEIDFKNLIYNEGNYHCWEHQGIPCFLYRSSVHGGWCGYAGVPPENKLYGEPYSGMIEEKIRVHGGVTFAGKWENVYPGDFWFFGFDTAHSQDLSFGLYQVIKDTEVGKVYKSWLSMRPGSSYKTKEYCIKEAEYMAEQIIHLSK